MKIQQAAEASGLAPDTIRFYERKGVLPRPPRSENGYRDYPPEHVETLRLVKGLREIGAPMREMAAIAQLAHDANCKDLRGGLVATLERLAGLVRERAAELERTQRHIDELKAGLERMKPDSGRVPGATPCDCYSIVSGPE